MIVFTATDLESQEVYVTTAKSSVEEEWASLLSQADSGTGGRLFERLRAVGAGGFEVAVWAYADTSGEARQSLREAREELGAKPVKSVRAAVAAPVKKTSAPVLKELMSELQEALAASPQDDDEEELPLRNKTLISDEASESETTAAPAPPPEAVATEDAGATDTDDAARLQARLEAMKAAQARLMREREQGRGSAREQRIHAAIEAERERREQRQQGRTRDERDDMSALMARVEMRRMDGRRVSAEKAKVARTQKAKADRQSAAAAQSASGRTDKPTASGSRRPAGAAAREKRIREAIEQEKQQRASARQSQAAAEAREMAAILERLDERGREADKSKRRR